MIYLDNNATTRPVPEVIAAMTHALEEGWANPSSKHPLGENAKRLLTAARAEVASFIGAQPVEVVFTSGATESNQQVLHGALQRPDMPRRIILSAIEHSGFLKAALRLRQEGVEVCLLEVDSDGRVRLDSLREALQQDAALVSVMAANNETGVLQPVNEICALVREHGIPMHVDATQIAGKQAFSFADCGADLLSLSAHKLHGPKGVGALLIRKGLSWPVMLAGQQERARRGGTENLPGIAGFAAAARHAAALMPTEIRRQLHLREALEARLERIPGCVIHGRGAARLPNTVSLRIDGLSADKLLATLERAGICASSGAACASGGSNPSHVLLAMGVEASQALGAIRISLGIDTEAEQLSQLADLLQTMSDALMPAAAVS